MKKNNKTSFLRALFPGVSLLLILTACGGGGVGNTSSSASYTIDPNTGALTEVGTPVAAGTGPYTVTTTGTIQ